MLTNKPKYLTLLYLSVFLIFFGRSLELLIWEAPLRAFFWDETLLKPVVEGVFNGNWTKYSQSLTLNLWIQRLNTFSGFVLLLSSISTILLYTHSSNKILRYITIVGIVVVGIILMLEYKEKFYHAAQFLEGFTQFFTPIFLLLYIQNRINIKQLSLGLRVMIALTFVGHGLYAINIYATPGYFIDMIIVITGVTENVAKHLLLVVGWLDIFLLIFLFIPKLQKAALYYAIIWGILTALARFVYHFILNDFHFSSIKVIYSTLFRLPHGLIPIAILILLINNKKTTNDENF